MSEETRDRVRLAIEQLGYKTNLQARSLASRRSSSIGLVYAADPETEPNSYYYSGLEVGALRACNRNNYQLQIQCMNTDGNENTQRVLKLLETTSVDGLILTPSFSDDLQLLNALIAADIPCVCISPGKSTRRVVPAVGMDDEQAGFETGIYLLGLGHRRFGYIHGMEDDMAARERYSGFARALSDAGIGTDAILHAVGNFTFQGGIDALPKLLNAGASPTAVICANDDMAAGAIFKAHERGILLPDELAIVGFDGAPVSEITWPPLTTIRQPIKEIGERAAEMLIDLIANGSGSYAANSFEVLPHQLIVRRSTAIAAPASSAGRD